MVKTLLGAFALAALPSALAFRNTSPFFVVSTVDLNLPRQDATVALASEVSKDILGALQGCPTKSYYLFKQLGLSSADFTNGRSVPQLLSQSKTVKTRLAIPELVGEIDEEAITEHLKSQCGYDTEFQVLEVPERIPFDTDLSNAFMKDAAQMSDFTLIYTTTPPDEEAWKRLQSEEHPPYEMENAYGNYDQIELKRDLASHVLRKNSTNDGGLFEKYQYFTPGLFMVFSAVIPLFLILLVGIRALTSLEVSYFAFSKEMGPNAQKQMKPQ